MRHQNSSKKRKEKKIMKILLPSDKLTKHVKPFVCLGKSISVNINYFCSTL